MWPPEGSPGEGADPKPPKKRGDGGSGGRQQAGMDAGGLQWIRLHPQGGSGQFHLLEKVQQWAGDAQAETVRLCARERNFMSVQWGKQLEAWFNQRVLMGALRDLDAASIRSGQNAAMVSKVVKPTPKQSLFEGYLEPQAGSGPRLWRQIVATADMSWVLK